MCLGPSFSPPTRTDLNVNLLCRFPYRYTVTYLRSPPYPNQNWTMEHDLEHQQHDQHIVKPPQTLYYGVSRHLFEHCDSIWNLKPDKQRPSCHWILTTLLADICTSSAQHHHLCLFLIIPYEIDRRVVEQSEMFLKYACFSTPTPATVLSPDHDLSWMTVTSLNCHNCDSSYSRLAKATAKIVSNNPINHFTNDRPGIELSYKLNTNLHRFRSTLFSRNPIFNNNISTSAHCHSF